MNASSIRSAALDQRIHASQKGQSERPVRRGRSLVIVVAALAAASAGGAAMLGVALLDEPHVPGRASGAAVEAARTPARVPENAPARPPQKARDAAPVIAPARAQPSVPERLDPTQEKAIEALRASGPADPRSVSELTELVETWRANLPLELDGSFELDDWSCFAGGCYAVARFLDAGAHAGVSQNLAAQRPGSTWSYASTPPVRSGSGTLTTLWTSQMRSD